MKLRTLLIGIAASLLTTLAILGARADLAPGINSTAQVVWNMVWEGSTTKPTYSATNVISEASATTTPGDICALQGSATKVLRVRRLILSGVGDVVVTEQFGISKLSGNFIGGSGGGGGTMNASAYDTTSAAATGVAEYWSSPPLQPATEIWLAEIFFAWANQTTGTGQYLQYEFGARGSAVQLRGTSQWVSLFSSTKFATAAKLSCTWEWTEE